eukprot:3094248-Lingulodinium_polyedra.AAC.1
MAGRAPQRAMMNPPSMTREEEARMDEVLQWYFAGQLPLFKPSAGLRDVNFHGHMERFLRTKPPQLFRWEHGRSGRKLGYNTR